MIRINVKELNEVLAQTPAVQNIMLVGKHGIGKSEILTDHFAQRGMAVVPLFLGQMSDPGDMIGLPNRDTQSGRTVFMPPQWWPEEGAPVVLFLDELNRARPELLQAVQDLALNRTLVGRRLPEGSMIIAAANVGDEYQLTDLDPALLSRFNVYEFIPEIEEWLHWARSRKIDMRVIEFIEKNNAYMDSGLSDTGDDSFEKTPDRRAWVKVSQIIAPHPQLRAELIKIIGGVVGVSAAMAFKRFVESLDRLSADQVLLHFGKKTTQDLEKMPLPDMIYLNKQMLYWIEENNPKLTDLKRQQVVKNLEKYFEHLKQAEQKEVIADFINRLEKGGFTQANVLILESSTLMKTFEQYIHSVSL